MNNCAPEETADSCTYKAITNGPAYKNPPSRLATILSLTIVSFACVAALTGCSGPTPTETVQQFLDGVKSNDSESIQKAYSGDSNTVFSAYESNLSLSDGENAASQEIASTFENELTPKLREFDYELSNEQIDGDTATVDVKVTTYALGDAFSSAISDYMSQALPLAFSGASEDELTDLATSLFTSKMKSMDKSYTDTVTVTLAKSDNEWRVDSLDQNNDLADALLGGLLTTAETISVSYGG